MDITRFLKEQWAGLFRDLLLQQSKKEEFENISLKVNELKEVTSTLQTYLESILKNVSKEVKVSETLIVNEHKRLQKISNFQRIKDNSYIKHLREFHHFPLEEIINSLNESQSLTELSERLLGPTKSLKRRSCAFRSDYIKNINEARILLGLAPYILSVEEKKKTFLERNAAKNHL